MGFVKDFLFGEKGQPGQVIDVTPDEFEALRSPLAAALMQQFQNPAQFQGPLTAPLGSVEQQLLQQMQQFQPGTGFRQQALDDITGRPLTAQQQAIQALLGGGAPSGFQQQALSQLGQPAQTGFQQQALAQVGQQGPTDFRQQMIQALTGGAPSGFQQQALSRLGQEGPTDFQRQALQQIQSGPQAELLNQTLRGDFLAPGSNPFLAASIEAAQRPILEQFGDETESLRAAFTRAGHTLTPGEGSSPFERERVRLATNVANSLGDVGARIGMANLTNERGLQAQAINQMFSGQQLGAGIEQGIGQQDIQQLLAGAGVESQLGHQLLQRAQVGGGLEQGVSQQQLQQLLAGTGIEQGIGQQNLQQLLAGAGVEQGLGQQLLQALTGAAGIEQGIGQQQLQGAQVGAGIEQGIGQQELQLMLQNLQAQALPRLIADMGIERGLQEFQSQQARLLQALGISGNLSTPTVATLQGTSSSPGFLHELAGGAGAGIGAAIVASDRRLKRNIERIGTTPGGLPWYKFQYLWGGPVRVGVMADEVTAVIPEAVGDILGFKTVDYSMVT